MKSDPVTPSGDASAVAAAYFDSGSFENELAQLVAHRTESQNPDSFPTLGNYLTQAMVPMLDEMGFESRIFDNPEPKAPPILIASRIENPDLPTVLIYGHGDVVRGQETGWSNNRAPFELRVEGDRIYGRGSADNKAQHLINIRALDAVIQARGTLGFNATIMIEMGEELGSPGLRAFCEAQKALLAADVFIASDGPRLVPDTPTVFTGSRAGCTFALNVNLREGGHHSGNFGGLLADPAIILAQALAVITDARGQIRVPEWRPDSLTPEIRRVLAKLPQVEAGVSLDDDWGEQSLTMAERVFGWSSFSVLAMKSGNPEAPVNAIAGHARAVCQLRYVVGVDPEEILPGLRRHLDAHGFDMIQIEGMDAPAPATRLDQDNPWLEFVLSALHDATGQKPHYLPNLGGSLPNDCFATTLGLPTIWIPHSYAGCNQHAPDEHILKPLARQALVAMAGLFSTIGKPGRIPQ